MCIDEEGILQRDEEYTMNIRYGQSCLEKMDHMFLLNERQRKLLIENYNIGEKISVTGYPRIEFLHILKKAIKNEIVKELNDKYGKFIFFATSFGNSNHVMGHYGLKSSFEQAAKILNKQQIEFFECKVALSEFIQQQYEDLLCRMSSDFSGTNIILRPHPSENNDYWRRKYKKFKNVVVDFRYPASYYIKACEVVVQYGSTLAIESNILEKPCLQFDPLLPEDLKPYNITENSQYVISMKSIEDTLNAIRLIVVQGKKYPIENEYPRCLGASENIMAKINKYSNYNGSKKLPYIMPVSFSNQNATRYLSNNTRHKLFWLISITGIINLLPQELLNGKFKILKKENKIIYLNHYKYKRRKYAKITMNRINELIQMFQNSWPSHNKNIRVKKVSFNAFEIISGE